MLILGGVVAVVVIAAIVAAVFIVIEATKSSEVSEKQAAISLEDFLQGRTATRSFNATWISGNNKKLHFTTLCLLFITACTEWFLCAVSNIFRF